MGKKKANGEGSITKRKDGRYMGRYTVESKRKAVYGDSFEEVRQKLNEILNEIAKGAYVEPNKYSVEKWLREWLELYALPTVKRSTYISYECFQLGKHTVERVCSGLSPLRRDRLWC